MQVVVSSVPPATVVALSGEITAATAPDAQAAIVPLAVPGARLVLDMTAVSFMSSAGLRLLLVVYRTITGKGGKVVLVGLSDDIADTMSHTGFLTFFAHHPTLAEGVAAVG